MKTNSINLLATGWFLAAVGIGFGQSTLQFTAPTYTVAEWAGTVTLTVQRTNDTSTEVSVDYATADGTATNGLKYMATNGTLAFAAGETNQTIVVPILNEGLVEGTKTFAVTLSNPTNAVLGTPTNATVSILDVDVGIQFQFANYNAANGWPLAEDVGTVLIGVVRGDDANIPVTVDFGTSDAHGHQRSGLHRLHQQPLVCAHRAAQVRPRHDPQRQPEGDGEQDLQGNVVQPGRGFAGNYQDDHGHDHGQRPRLCSSSPPTTMWPRTRAWR